MNSIVFSIISCIVWVILFLNIYFMPKTDKKLPGFVWAVITIVIINCYNALAAAIINPLHIPVNILSISVAELILIIGIRIYVIYINNLSLNKKIIFNKSNWKMIPEKRQKHEYSYADVAVLIVIALVALIVFKVRYGAGYNINYATIDPAVHVRNAMNVLNNNKVDGMFYSSFINALFIETFSPGYAVYSLYKLYIVAEMFQLILSGYVFYAAIRRFCTDKFLKVAAVICTLMYVVGYPLNNTLYGFTYLGIGVTLVGVLFCLSDIYINEEVNQEIIFILMMLVNVAVIICYALFVPVTYISLLIVLLIHQQSKKKLVSPGTIRIGLEVFLIPCIVGLAYTYSGIFGGSTTVNSAIAAEGAIYRDLYSNFIVLVPIGLYAIINLIMEKKNNLLVFLYPILTGFMLVLLYRGLSAGKVSSYYYYKNYYFAWLVIFILAFIGITYVSKNTRILLVTTLLVWTIIIVAACKGKEQGIYDKNQLFDPIVKASMFADLYSYNYNELLKLNYDMDKYDLYSHVYTDVSDNGKNQVPIVSYWEDAYWYQAIEGSRFDDWDFSADYYDKVIALKSKYVLVLTDSKDTVYTGHQAYFDGLNKIYSNSAGFIAEVK